MISMIVAYARDRVIGNNGTIPWRLPEDQQRFKRITAGHTVVMGRKTLETIGRPLPRRRNVVITRNQTFARPGVEVLHSTDEVFALSETDEVFIIGGQRIYQAFLDKATRLYITEIDFETAGDTFFPAWKRESFRCTLAQPGVVNEQNPLPHTFFIYERRGLSEH